MARLIKTTGQITDEFPNDGNVFSLEELQKFVDGYIEVVILDQDRVMIVNEDGKLLGLPINYTATKIWKGNAQRMRDFIVGDALLCSWREAGMYEV